MSITITSYEAAILVNWYRCSHHLEKCRYPIKTCHNLREKLQKIRENAVKIKFEQVKFRKVNYFLGYCTSRISAINKELQKGKITKEEAEAKIFEMKRIKSAIENAEYREG